MKASVWENAKAENTPDSLNKYLQQYPNGAYKNDAIADIKAIEDCEKQKAIEAAEQLKKDEAENKL